MSRKAWTEPGKDGTRPGKIETPTLASIARRSGRSGPRRQCRICLAEEPLDKGICIDRAACEERQPPLIPVEEL